MNILETHSLKTDSRIGLAKMEGLLNSVLAELQSQSSKIKQLEQQMSKASTPRAGGTEHLQVRMEQLEARSLGANSLVSNLQQQFQQLQQQQVDVSTTAKSAASSLRLHQLHLYHLVLHLSRTLR
eukprot:Transcript_25567.p2 GENE.Transcript_25567~~Transcript_25567.p2  ORF type:complete len:125 (-),score=48.68 Transcript_25567:4-378(-)